MNHRQLHRFRCKCRGKLSNSGIRTLIYSIPYMAIPWLCRFSGGENDQYPNMLVPERLPSCPLCLQGEFYYISYIRICCSIQSNNLSLSGYNFNSQHSSIFFLINSNKHIRYHPRYTLILYAMNSGHVLLRLES